MDEGRQFLESQVSAAEGRKGAALDAVKVALSALDASISDLVTWQKALESYTRGKENPYHPPDDLSAIEMITEEFGLREGKTETKRMRPKREAVRQSPKFSKRGTVRRFLESQNGKGLEVGEIFDGLPKDLPEPISREDLHRILPSLFGRGEIARDARGKYRGHSHAGNPKDNGLFNGS